MVREETLCKSVAIILSSKLILSKLNVGMVQVQLIAIADPLRLIDDPDTSDNALSINVTINCNMPDETTEGEDNEEEDGESNHRYYRSACLQCLTKTICLCRG